MNLGLHVKQAEVHGMSQRGGAVESHLRISDSEIFSDLIPRGKADIILSIEPMEALRYLPFLSPNGIIITAVEAFKNIAQYPEEKQIFDTIKSSAKYILIDATELAKAVGSNKTFNVVMLGAAAPYLGISQDELEKAISQYFVSKGQSVVDMNLTAFKKGLENK